MVRHFPVRADHPRDIAQLPLFSFVVAVYDTELFLPEFLASLDALDWPANELELIFVDDGSSDSSPALIAEWLDATRFPGRLLTQPNAGPGAARNRGLDAARGQWVSFPDSDDVLAVDYLRMVSAFIDGEAVSDAAMVAARLVRFIDDTSAPIQAHALDFKYDDRERVVDLSESPRFVQLHTNVGFYRRDLIEAHRLRFDPEIRPVFEDAVFNIGYLSLAPRPTVAYLRDARYYYRRRADGTSLTSSPRHDPAMFDQLPSKGYLAVLERFAPEVPQWIQNTVFYDLQWLFKAELRARPDRCYLDRDALDRFDDLLCQILRHLDVSTLMEFHAVDIPVRIRLALVARKGCGLPAQNAYVGKLDQPMQVMLISYFTDHPDLEEELRVDGVLITPAYAKTTIIRYFDRPWLYQRDLWVPSLRPATLRVEGRFMPLVYAPLGGAAFATWPQEVWRRYAGHGAPSVLEAAERAAELEAFALAAALEPAGLEAAGLASGPTDGSLGPEAASLWPPGSLQQNDSRPGILERTSHWFADQRSRPAIELIARLSSAAVWSLRLAIDDLVPVIGPAARQREPFAGAVRRRAGSPRVRRRFEHAWVLMDRDTMAQDNAEAFYRYLRAEQPEVNAWFALSPTSPDWPRLEADGFRLLEYGSVEYAMALRNADYLISAQADNYVLRPEGAFYGARHWKFVFLQHGVIDKDLSGWLNGLPIRCMITTTEAEHHSIVTDGSPYKLSEKEVERTGLPRHDRLLMLARQGRAGPGGRSRRSILIAPTWRAYLMAPEHGGHHRELAVELRDTPYFLGWQRLLNDPGLAELAESYGLELVFLAHPHLQRHLTADVLTGPARVVTPAEVDVQRVIADASVMITDYSSLAFDAAYVGTPSVYYQFDAEDFFSGRHMARQGEFLHDRDGFGPVVTEPDGVIGAAAELLDPRSNLIERYRRRMARTFTFRDGECSRRVYEAIRRREVPVLDPITAGLVASRDVTEPRPEEEGRGSEVLRVAG